MQAHVYIRGPHHQVIKGSFFERCHGLPVGKTGYQVAAAAAKVPRLEYLPGSKYAACLHTRRKPYRFVVAHGAKSSIPKHQTWLANGHADAPDSPFYELRLTDAERNAGGAIGRRNYSFLSSPAAQQVADVNWSDIFEDPSRPLIVDLGCGAGRYILLMAHRLGQRYNYLGLDVHKALLDRANGWAAARGLSGHVHYLQANAVVAASSLLVRYPGPLKLVSVQYPDPQQRRQRHMVGRELVEALAAVMPPGARVYLTADFEDTATYMRNAFEHYGAAFFRPDDIHTQKPVFPATPITRPPAPPFAAISPNAATPPSSPSASASAKSADGSVSSSPANPTSAAAAAQGNRRWRSASAFEPSEPSQGPVLQRGGSIQDEAAQRKTLSPTAAQESNSEAAMESWSEEEEERDLLWYRGKWERAGWLVRNPVGAPTEREVYVEKTGQGPVFRFLLVRR